MPEGHWSAQNFFMMVSIILMLCAIVWSLWRAHKLNGGSRYANFNLIDLFTDRNGIISRPATMETVAFIIMTWGFVVLTANNRLTEWYAGIYIAAFVLRAAYSAYLSKDHVRKDDHEAGS